MTTNYQIQYSRFDHDYTVHVEGEYIGSKPTYIEAEEMATEYISDLARQTQIETADLEALAAEQPTTETPLLVEIDADAIPNCDALYCTHPSTHTVNDNGSIYYLCCEHYPDIAGEMCDCALYVNEVAAAEYLRRADPLPGICKACYKPHPTYKCPEIRALLFAPVVERVMEAAA